jgi:hypothetical protein
VTVVVSTRQRRNIDTALKLIDDIAAQRTAEAGVITLNDTMERMLERIDWDLVPTAALKSGFAQILGVAPPSSAKDVAETAREERRILCDFLVPELIVKRKREEAKAQARRDRQRAEAHLVDVMLTGFIHRELVSRATGGFRFWIELPEFDKHVPIHQRKQFPVGARLLEHVGLATTCSDWKLVPVKVAMLLRSSVDDINIDKIALLWIARRWFSLDYEGAYREVKPDASVKNRAAAADEAARAARAVALKFLEDTEREAQASLQAFHTSLQVIAAGCTARAVARTAIDQTVIDDTDSAGLRRFRRWRDGGRAKIEGAGARRYRAGRSESSRAADPGYRAHERRLGLDLLPAVADLQAPHLG